MVKGKVAAALMAKASDLLSHSPGIEKVRGVGGETAGMRSIP
jgi:hypothetical protein